MGAIGSKKREYSFDKEERPASENDNYFVERVVCNDDEVAEGSMAEFEMGSNGKVLLVKQNGVFTALGPKCTHYGAPLIKGVLIGGKIRCPWHGACFDSRTGDIEDFPGLDSLPCYDVSVENGEVRVKAPLSTLKSNKRVRPMTKCSPANPSTFIIIGGGGAGGMCAETLRQEGFNGKIILISKEKLLPYDRPKLSKALDTNGTDLCLRKEEFYKQADISLMLETEVTSVDTKEKWVSCNNGKLMVKYDCLMIATGGQPIELDVEGSNLQNVFYLRTPEDGNAIAKNSVGKSVVIVGTSFIGMEVASYLLTKARSINMIGRGKVPFSAVFGEEIGQRIKKMFEEKGVIFHSNTQVSKFLGKEGVLTSMELASGDLLTAEICIVGVGVKPSTGFLQNSGIRLNSRGLVSVNEMLETSVKGVFSCGDIVEFPLSTYDNRPVNICHWQMALAHGRTAAMNMLGKNLVLHSVPFFWSMMCGKSFRYAGYGAGFDDIVIKGSVDKLEFVAYFCVEQKVVAVCTINKDPEAAKFASCLSLGDVIMKNQVANN